MMKLTISKVTSRARLGVITGLGQNGEKTLEFPGCLLYTRTVSAPHLTYDTLQTIEDHFQLSWGLLAQSEDDHTHRLVEVTRGRLRTEFTSMANDHPYEFNRIVTGAVFGPRSLRYGAKCLIYSAIRQPVRPALGGVSAGLAEHQDVLEEYKEGVGKFAGLSDAVLYCSINDPVTPSPSGYNTNKTVSVWGSGGRLELTPQKFMSLQRHLKVDWFQCLSDGDVMVAGSSRKRAVKSVDRSLGFLDECLQLLAENEELKETVMIGAIEGGDLLEERLRSARETAKRPVGGFLLDGLQGSSMTQETRLNLISSVTAELPDNKPRLIHGVGRPDEVLDCIECGVDLFDSSFPYEVTERGCALSFTHHYQLDPETASGHQSPDNAPVSHVLDKEELCNGEEERESADPEIDRSRITSYEICLREKRFRDDLRPLLPGCTCYCCRNHNRAYVHHLLTSKELLAGILLMIHNFQQYFSFFRSVREALRDGKLDVLRKTVQRQAA